jgi:eukaryotic-like serine/threonine-protein kinase
MAAAFREVAAGFERRLGTDHGYTLAALNNLANVVSKRGDHAEAERVHRRLLELRRARHGPEHHDVAGSLQNLATMLARQQKYDEAAPLALSAHQMFGRVRGPRYANTALPLLTLAEIQLELHDWSAAEATAARAVMLLRESLPPGHFITAVAEGRLGRALAGQGRQHEAEMLLRESLRRLAESEADTTGYAAEIQAALDRITGH